MREVSGMQVSGRQSSEILSYVAIGDSFTEGMNDTAPGGGFRGWADRLAEMIAAQDPGFRYAELGPDYYDQRDACPAQPQR